MTTFDVRTVKLRSGEQFRDARRVELQPFELAGERYLPIPDNPEAAFTMTRMTSGFLFELEFEYRLAGPCFRCLADARATAVVNAQEYHATGAGDSDELRTPYLVSDRLDLSAWARDAVALSLPDKILCQPDCAGLCPVCGKDLNLEPHEHADEATDPRWAALGEVRDRL